MKRLFNAPTTVNLELTEACNVKCRHCYNFWRDESVGQVSLNEDSLGKMIDKISDAGVFHTVLTGGEPMAKFKLLCFAIERFKSKNISISVNSNLMLCDDKKANKLANLGVDHILTSLPSCDPVKNDYIMCKPGSFELIMQGIKAAVGAGIRVSVNMVITRDNFQQVYETGKLVADMGCQRIFITRAVPPTYSDVSVDNTYTLTPDEQRFALDEALRIKEDSGIQLGSLVSYPLCFLGDLDKYSDFVGRGCPAQAGHRMSINATGEVHACVHEEDGYGNIFENSILEIFQSKMRKWHDGRFHYSGCEGCRYIDICESGCSMTALAVHGDLGAKDTLFLGPHAFEQHFNLVQDSAILTQIFNNASFTAPERLRFRKEDGFYLLNIRWGNSITVDTGVAEFLMEKQQSGQSFTLEEFTCGDEVLLANLYSKDAIESTELESFDKQKDLGLSFNFDALEPTV